LRLDGLNAVGSRQLLAEKEVAGLTQVREQLIERYEGNPLAFKIVAQTIVDLFGSEIAPFLEQGEVVFGSVCELLGEHFARLADMPPACRAKALRVGYRADGASEGLLST